ncbi:MAG: phytanoyl-CoA dioxygenase family protein [Candidatus Poribacteria bacterium]|nr:phytanoyl-CoA dioxygenase family protein [Candidatus Poribacteria bacterium]
MNEQELFLFDLQGYVTVPNALSADQVGELNDLLEEHMVADMKAEDTTKRFGGLLNWGKPFRDLIDNETMLPYLETILGRGFRLDHIYLDVIRAGLSPIGAGLHGGATPYDASQYYHYHNGKMYNGLTVAAYNLMDVNPGDGGFGCVPGSHKSNFRFPNEWRDTQNPHECVKAVTGPAGTAIIFTEAMTHAALPWKGAGERRTIFFKYSPFPLSWSNRYYNTDEYEGLSDRQRAIMRAPSAANRRNPYE